MSSLKSAVRSRLLWAALISAVAFAVPSHPAAAQSIQPIAAISDTCLVGLFAVNNWPGGCWRPYATTSPFNTPLPTTARVATNSAAMVSRLTSFGTPQHLVAGNAQASDDWGHPTYYPRLTDPLFTLHCTKAWGTCPVEGMAIRIPDAAKPAGGLDAHMTVIDQLSGWEYDMWGVQLKPAGGGRLDFMWGGRTKIAGDGLGSYATASRFGNLAGAIRGPELQSGRINHALFMVIKCDSGGTVWPAMQAGTKCADATNAMPMGSRVQLNLTAAKINSLAMPAWKKTILQAMREFGMYVGDTGGTSWGLQFESGTGYTSLGSEDPLVTFAKSNAVPTWENRWVFNIRDGIDWKSSLRVISPCTSQGTC